MVERFTEAGAQSRAQGRHTRLGLNPQKIVDEYRCKLRATETGLDGEKVALRRIQDLANKVRPQALLVRNHNRRRSTSAQVVNTV